MTLNRSALVSSCFGTPGTNAANLSPGISTKSGTCIKRTRFTGPSTRYRSAAVSWNCSRRNCSSSAGMLSATSSRTESPKWRCESSPASAVRRSLISSSSRNRSLLRVTRIEADRREERDHFPQEIIVQPGALFPRPLRLGEETHALLRKLRKNLLVEQPVLLGDQRMGAFAYQGENLRRRRLSGNRYLVAEPDALLQLGDSDLEELVQVARQDAQEAQPLQRRKPPVLSLGEHALVECQDGELAREELGLDLARRKSGSLEHGEV